MNEEKKLHPNFLEDAMHVFVNEVAPSIVNGILELLPRDVYAKLIQSSDWVQKIEPIISTLILRWTNHARWADSLTTTILARLREEVRKRAKGEHTATTSTKEKKEKVVAGNSIRALLLVADKTNVDCFLARLTFLPEEKRRQLLDLDVTVAKDKVITNLATCDEALFPSFVDLLIKKEEVEPVQPSFIEELTECSHFVAYFSSLPTEKRVIIKRHIEHIPLESRHKRLKSLNDGSQDDFNSYVATVIAAREYCDLDKLLPSLVQQVKDFFGEAHEKRTQQGGFLAGFKEGRENYLNRRRRR